MSDIWGELRSAIATGDLEDLDLTGLPYDAVRSYLARVPTKVLITGAAWYKQASGTPITLQEPWHEPCQLRVCGVPWIDVGMDDLETDGTKWSIGLAWHVLPLWEDWARESLPEHQHVARRCIEVMWEYHHKRAPMVEVQEFWLEAKMFPHHMVAQSSMSAFHAVTAARKTGSGLSSKRALIVAIDVSNALHASTGEDMMDVRWRLFEWWTLYWLEEAKEV